MKKKPFLLATDLDNTLVGNQQALSFLFNYFREGAQDTALVYVTGRHFDSALSLIEQEQLPAPDVLVSDVGTAIYHSNPYAEDEEWTEIVQRDWEPDRILEIAARFPALERQALPHTKRISFTVTNDEPAVQAFRQQLLTKRLPHTFVYSSGRDVDILPLSSGKGKAVEYVLKTYAHPDVKVLIAGDSGNDAEMLSIGYPAVIVGNAQDELKHLADHPQLYRATAHYAAGIQEAWEHFYGTNGQWINEKVPSHTGGE